jgi:hypothetical protein
MQRTNFQHRLNNKAKTFSLFSKQKIHLGRTVDVKTKIYLTYSWRNPSFVRKN